MNRKGTAWMSCFFYRSCSWEDLHGWGNLHAWALKLYRKILGTWAEMSQRTRATWTIDQSTYIWSLPVACDLQSMGMLPLGTQYLMIKQPMSDHSQRKWHKDNKEHGTVTFWPSFRNHTVSTKLSYWTNL